MDTFTQAITIQENPQLTYIIYIKNGAIALKDKNENDVKIPTLTKEESINYDFTGHIFLGYIGTTHCYAQEVDGTEDHVKEYTFHARRSLFGLIDDNIFNIIMLGNHLLTWNKQTQHCGICGSTTKPSEKERSKVCISCKHTIYPSPMPATITAVMHEDKILLARHSKFSQMYTVLAGYVDPGESLEECVQREIKEEVNIAVKNIRYFMSQPWGYSQSLMVGFLADYAGGEIIVDQDEIIEANWFTVDKLPEHPIGPSLSYYLIQHFIKKNNNI